ncbi:unnamed protein product [Orchesella dallaii]|uniref:Uncharacterized protein n=1 Tax=Orchesella dallaii TaxID=48710 RepID=A0ABP1QP58_9HEXA
MNLYIMDPNLNPATTPKSGSKSHANANTSSQQRGHTDAPTVSNQNGKNSDGSIHMATLFSEKVPATKARKRSCTDCLMRHIPFYMKVLQVAAINVSMLYLTKIDQVKKAMNYSSFWTVILAV